MLWVFEKPRVLGQKVRQNDLADDNINIMSILPTNQKMVQSWKIGMYLQDYSSFRQKLGSNFPLNHDW